MNNELEAKKVRWRCNRGMLELDLFLIPFAENHFGNLSEENKKKFVELLTHEDPVLFSWFMGHEQAQEDMQSIVLIVKEAVHLT